MTGLSVLCVTKGEAHAHPFLDGLARLAATCRAELVLAGDGDAGMAAVRRAYGVAGCERGARPPIVCVRVAAAGYVESVLDDALRRCTGEYVLRMDDDERCSPAMVRWLAEERYREEEHWKFCTANLWRDERSVPIDPPLWPDHHTRLSVRAKASGRHTPHAGSPYGGGALAPVVHEHHKFLVRSVARRRALARHYERLGALLMPFTLPEDAFSTLTLAPLGDGTVREWAPHELETVRVGPEVLA